MRKDLRAQFVIVAAAALIFFTNLGAVALWDMDEALYSTCARDMLQRGDWVVPWFNGQMFVEKPPLMFWTMMAGYELFGVNELAARFFSAVMGVGTALMVYHLGRILFNRRVGLWAGLATASTIIFTVSARAATVDMALTFVTTAAFLLFVLAGGGGFLAGRSGDKPLKLPYAILMYACVGVAVLGKGPVMLLPLAALAFYALVAKVPRPWVPLALLYTIVLGSMLGEGAGLLIGRWTTPIRLLGILLPVLCLGWYLLTAIGWRSVWRTAWQMRPITAVIIIAVVAVPWYVMVGMRTDGRWLREFILDFNLRPFQQPIQGHGDVSSLDRVWAALGSMLFYFIHIPFVLIGFFPWAIFLGAAVGDAVRRIVRREDEKGTDPICQNGPESAAHKLDLSPFSPGSNACLLALCWFSVWFVFWSLCKTKLPHYTLPAYPALALVTGCFIDRWLADPTSIGRGPLRNAWLSLILVGVGLMIALPIVAWILLPGEEVLGLAGLILVSGGGWCWWKTAHEQHLQAAVALALTSVIFLTAVFGFGARLVDRHQNSPAMIAAIHADCGDAAPPIAIYRFFRFSYSTVFYAGYPVTECENDQPTNKSARQDLQQFLAGSTRSYVITTDEYEPELMRDFPGTFRVVFRQPCFLAPGKMVVLASFQKSTPSGRE